MTSEADALVQQLPRVTLVVGKGGVGKTTTAAALAVRASEIIGSTLVLSTDPARALPTVLDHPLGAEPTPVSYASRLKGQLLDANALRSTFMARWGDVIRVILDRGTYLDDSDIGPLVDTALPGSDEIFSALALADLLADSPAPGTASRAYERIVVDTAPTGHTLRLLNLPGTFRALVRLLDTMQSKHRYMVRTLTRSYRSDDADAFLVEMSRLVSTLEDVFRRPEVCAAVMVSQPQPLVRAETRRFLEALSGLGVTVKAVIWNGVDGAIHPVGNAEQYVVPRLARWPVGAEGLERWLDALAKAARSSAKPAKPVRAAKRHAVSPSGAARLGRLVQPLTIVAGKGGVGKTTVASALALHTAERHRTLLVSTDPAPSLADAFAQEIPDHDTVIAGRGHERLFARQMDATAGFARLRDEYQSRVDALFEGLVGRGVDLTHDRAVVRDLLSLAPPGVDEVYALSLLSDALFKDRYARVIVDPAPTGHLLRLLEMPELALAWSHQLLRLMLKYKDVTGLGETAAEILQFARSLRVVGALLHDGERCGVVLVTLDEPVVRAETERLATEVVRRGVRVSGVVLNRATTASALPVPDAPVHLQAPAVDPPPTGPDALIRWAETWVLRDG